MKRFLLMLWLLLCAFNINAQITVTPRYQPTDWSKFADDIVSSTNRAYDEFEGEVEKLSSYILSLLGQNIDIQMREFLNKKYEQTVNIL